MINTGSGRQQADATRAALARELGAAGRRFEMRVVDDPRRLEIVAREAAAATGTLCTVAHAAFDAGCPFAALPRGTFNYFSRDHGIPVDLEPSIRLLLDARAYPVQVGFVNARMFLVNASLGLYPRLLEDRETYQAAVRPQPARRAVVGAFHAAQAAPPSAFAPRTRRQYDRDPLVDALPRQQPAADGADRHAGGSARWNRACSPRLRRGRVGRLSDSDHVMSFAFERIVVTHPSKKRWLVKIATDGEITRLRMPLEFRVSDKPLLLLKPEPAAALANRS
ncbi:Transcription regulator [contains diacylglycerol kinase catalytic domain] [Candidatus Paraburkholderia kirkii]|nr:Transcription regulator [contains diacylglycerol kinase catalytic domain] [Candidatus Paraburkholderia kirkii]